MFLLTKMPPEKSVGSYRKNNKITSTGYSCKISLGIPVCGALVTINAVRDWKLLRVSRRRRAGGIGQNEVHVDIVSTSRRHDCDTLGSNFILRDPARRDFGDVHRSVNNDAPRRPLALEIQSYRIFFRRCRSYWLLRINAIWICKDTPHRKLLPNRGLIGYNPNPR